MHTSVVAEAVLMIGDRAQGHLGAQDHGPAAEATHRHLRESIVPGIVSLSSSYADQVMLMTPQVLIDLMHLPYVQVSLSW